MDPRLVGALVVALPPIVVAVVALRRQPRAILWFAVACILIGTGYLTATGATGDIGAAALKLAGR